MEDIEKVTTILRLLIATDKATLVAPSHFKSVFTDADITKAKKMLWELLEKPSPKSGGRI